VREGRSSPLYLLMPVSSLSISFFICDAQSHRLVIQRVYIIHQLNLL
jgi:hypothetical protein